MKLYCFGESGNSYKAALALELAGVGWEPVFVDFSKARQERPNIWLLIPWAKCLI